MMFMEYFFLTISAILFPFSVLVWNSIVNLFFNNSVINTITCCIYDFIQNN